MWRFEIPFFSPFTPLSDTKIKSTFLGSWEKVNFYPIFLPEGKKVMR